ncbi:MAG: M15 family metallopeptidase [Spirochaetaceae bacterium]|nr:M15 family metallopeptidase [Spirochaetaceae bacterium]
MKTGVFLAFFLLGEIPCSALGFLQQGGLLGVGTGASNSTLFSAETPAGLTAEEIPPVLEMNPLSPNIHASAAPSRAEQVMRALLKAHPKRIKDIAFVDGDWAVELNGDWYFYAEGKILPQDIRSSSEPYTPQPFYNYPKDLPAWQRPTKEEAARLAQLTIARRSQQAANRSQFFYNALWGIHNRAEAWEQVKTIRFLDKNILVHHAILEELALVEQQITKTARNNRQVRQWLDSIGTISAWNWRTIADTQSTSNHAYGMAIDILPKTAHGLETYWLWTAQKREDWWNVPYSARYHPPDAVVKIFESYGFIWGGKWLFYDTMHFEYRPEILLLNNIAITGQY